MEDRDSLLLIDKTFASILEETLEDLEGTVITNIGPGGVARLILAKVSAKLADFYEVFQENHAQAFLSMAIDGKLDLVGQLLGCTRYAGEEDEEYRYRISQQTLTAEKANETAIRLAVLTSQNVKDVVIREYSHGTGSFSIYPILDNPYDYNAELEKEIMENVKKTRAAGVKALVLSPRLAPVELRMRLGFSHKVSEADKVLARNQATRMVRTYVNSKLPGETLDLEELKLSIRTSFPSILDIEIYHFRIKNRPMLFKNQASAWNERFTEAQIPSAILVS